LLALCVGSWVNGTTKEEDVGESWWWWGVGGDLGTLLSISPANRPTIHSLSLLYPCSGIDGKTENMEGRGKMFPVMTAMSGEHRPKRKRELITGMMGRIDRSWSRQAWQASR